MGCIGHLLVDDLVPVGLDNISVELEIGTLAGGFSAVKGVSDYSCKRLIVLATAILPAARRIAPRRSTSASPP